MQKRKSGKLRTFLKKEGQHWRRRLRWKTTRHLKEVLKLEEENTAMNKQQMEKQETEILKDANELHDPFHRKTMQQEFMRYTEKVVSILKHLGIRNCRNFEWMASWLWGMEFLEKKFRYVENTGRTHPSEGFKSKHYERGFN